MSLLLNFLGLVHFLWLFVWTCTNIRLLLSSKWFLSLFLFLNIVVLKLAKVLWLRWDLLNNVLVIKIFFTVLLYCSFFFFDKLLMDDDLSLLLIKTFFPSTLEKCLTLILDSLYAFFYQNDSFQRNFLQSPRFFFRETLKLFFKFF